MPTPERTEKTPSDIVGQPCAVPLIERLRSVPKEARAWIETGHCAHRNIPYGAMCHEAADALASHADLVAQNEALRGLLRSVAPRLEELQDTAMGQSEALRNLVATVKANMNTPPAKA